MNVNIDKEIIFKASRSSGPGGQHGDKVSTRVEAYFNIPQSALLDENDKKRLLGRLKSKLDKNGVLRVVDQSSRSQSTNKERAKQKILAIIGLGLTKSKRRIPTKISVQKQRERVEMKRHRSRIKDMRKKVRKDDLH